MRGFVIGMIVGTIGAILLALETIRRNAERDRVGAQLWPRPDGTVRRYGEVWDHPTPADPVTAA